MDLTKELKDLDVRYQKAMTELRRAGFYVRNNVQKCCRGCVSQEHDMKAWDVDGGQPGLWTFGGQGRAVYLCGDYAEYRNGFAAKTNWVNHANLDPEMWQIALEIYERNGIKVEWNGESSSCVVIDYVASVVADDLATI